MAAPRKVHHHGSKTAQHHLVTPHSTNDTDEPLPPAPHRIPYADSRGAVNTPQPRTRSAPSFSGPHHDLRRARGGPTAFPSPAKGWTRTNWRVQRRSKNDQAKHSAAPQQGTNVVSTAESGKQSPSRTYSCLPCYKPHATLHEEASASVTRKRRATSTRNPPNTLASIDVHHRSYCPSTLASHRVPAARPPTLASSHPPPASSRHPPDQLVNVPACGEDRSWPGRKSTTTLPRPWRCRCGFATWAPRAAPTRQTGGCRRGRTAAVGRPCR